MATVETITDAELCAAIRMSPRTLRHHFQHGPPRVRNRNTRDVRTIQHFTVGGQRRWVKASVDEFIHGPQEKPHRRRKHAQS
jgi:hypothetical protein